MQINCHVPIVVRMVGEPTPEQLEALGHTLAGTVAARLAHAERVLSERHHREVGVPLPVPEPYAPGRDTAYDRFPYVPGYEDGHRAAVPLRAAGSPPAGTSGPTPAGRPAHGGTRPTAPARHQDGDHKNADRKGGARAVDRDPRKPAAAAPPRTRVFTYPGQSKWRLLYPATVTKEQVASWLFAGGGLPDGFSLTADPSGSSAPGTAWYLSWKDFRSRHPMGTVDFTTTLVNLLTPYGQALVNRALIGGDATDEEIAAWQAGQQESKRRWQEYDRQFVPALAMTRGEAIARLPAGPYEVNGQFIWIGFKESLGRSIVETYPLSSNETFNRDVRHYLRHGLSVSQAIAAFTAQWDEIFAIEMAFAGTGAGYRTPGAAEATETAGLEHETSLIERRLARAQGLLTEGDIALSKAASTAETTVIRTELTQLDTLPAQTTRTEITTVRPTATEAAAASVPHHTAPTSGPASPGRRIGFVQPSTTPSDTAETPSTGYKPVTGFGRDRTTLPVQPLDTGPSEQQTHTQLPPARQVPSTSTGPDTAPIAATGQRRGQPTTATAGKRPGADTPPPAPAKPSGNPAAPGKGSSTQPKAATKSDASSDMTAAERDWEKAQAEVKRREQPAPRSQFVIAEQYDSPEAAVGQLEGEVTVTKKVRNDNEGLRAQGFKEIWYVTDSKDVRWTVAYNRRTGKFAVAHKSSLQ
ncbi:hypothetical protein AB0M32_34335 [Streptomyces sp. NPDC051985]|uniref:hypothetical protein n=1 Tax=Streptomyces sp. NPDC051985 TaxID=3155807 RepID=UPI0034188475